jgi:site-specific DNA recombinase
MPRLGYDVAPEGGRLVVNKEEAEQVRTAFSLYVENPSLVAVSQELNRRELRRKCWKTKKGLWHEGKPWDVANLRRMLTDPIFSGKMTLGTETFEGEHEAIVPKALFQKVQTLMKDNRRSGGASIRNQEGALLRGLLRCTACDAAMIHSWTRRSGRLHRYYVCSKAQKRGWSTCPTKSVPAAEIESFLVERIRSTDPGCFQDVQARENATRALAALAPIWDVLLAPEKERVLQLLIEGIDYDGNRLQVRFRITGLAALAAEVAEKTL